MHKFAQRLQNLHHPVFTIALFFYSHHQRVQLSKEEMLLGLGTLAWAFRLGILFAQIHGNAIAFLALL